MNGSKQIPMSCKHIHLLKMIKNHFPKIYIFWCVLLGDDNICEMWCDFKDENSLIDKASSITCWDAAYFVGTIMFSFIQDMGGPTTFRVIKV